MIRPTSIVLCLLAGCGVLENNRNSLARAQRTRDASDVSARIDGMAVVSDGGVPNARVACTRQSTVVVGSVSAEHSRNGRATFKADFEGQTFTGRMGTFWEHQGGINAAAYSDAVTPHDCVLGQTVTSDISGRYTGRLQGAGAVMCNNVAVNGAACGATRDSLVVFGISEAGGFCRDGNNLTSCLQLLLTRLFAVRRVGFCFGFLCCAV